DLHTGERQWSDALCRLYGFPADCRPSLDDVFALMVPEDRHRMRATQSDAVRDPRGIETEFRVVIDGHERTMVTRVRPVFDDDGAPSKMIGVVQDVTEEKQKAEELRRRTTQQSAVANLGQIALTGASIEFLLDQAVAAVSAVLDVELTSILRNDGDLHVIAADGWRDEGAARRIVHAGSNSQEEFTIETGHAVVMTDITLETRFTVAERFIEQGVSSGITVPIQSADGTSWGVLAVHARTRRTYAVYDVEFLRSIATVIGQAIDRSRADAELRTRARQQSAIAKLGSLVLNALDGNVFDRACELLMAGVGADYAFLGEITPEQTLRLRAGIAWDALPHEIVISANAQAGYTILHHEPVLVDDYATEQRFATYNATVPHGIRSGLMVPVASATRMFGVLSVQSHTPGHFRGEDVDFVQSLGNMLAEAMERELVRQAVVESEHRYRRIFEGATEIIFTIDSEGRFVALSAAFESITGWSREEWLGRPFIEVVVEEDRSRAGEIYTRMLHEHAAASAEMTLIGKDRLVHVEVSSFTQTTAGVVTEVYGFARDVTEARRATVERERVTRNLELLLESTIEGIFTIDLEGRCTMVNRAAAAFLQRSPEELRGQWMHGLLHHGVSEDNCAMLHVLRSGEPCTAKSDTFTLKDGTLMPVAYSAAPIVDAGRTVGVVVTFTDLSEHRKLEARLEQANRLSSLGRLAATVAHEFNNVLMGIAPFVEVIRRAPTPQKVTTSLDHIANSVKRGRRITQDILRFTQPAEPVRARVDVASWLQSVSVEARSLLSSLYQVQLDVEPVAVEGDANQLHQIFTNLILNARDAMPAGGTNAIAARRE
ncbi:MAG TPA: PAS domain S-box protein, partial [Thermoanaerobaculia bacterium]|nr:PAS domain S-box protein [Thermoanaerobaculia bacterium]